MPAAEERRTVVILFAQAVGLAEMPEAQRASVADRLFGRLRAIIERSGGVVDKFIGDVVMALWGAPVAHEDDPARAARASLAMGNEVEAFASEHGLELGMRGGINRGEVLFGSVAGERPTAMGDPVNVAQRLMAAAEEGSVIASRGVERLAKHALRFRAMPALRLKGREQEVEAFLVEEELAGRTEVRLLPERGAPIVGREPEFERLHALVAGWNGAFAVVTGDAGIGKSRLLAEFRSQLRARRPDARVLVGRSLQDVHLPLFAFGEILRIEAGVPGFAPGDAERLVRWVEAGFEKALPDPMRRENAAHLLVLSLGYSIPGTRVKDMEPKRFEAETRAAWADWFRARADGAPLLLCIEDLHWADDGALALLETLASDLKGLPVAILATSRPEGRRPAGFDSVALGDLDHEAALRLAENAFHAPVVPDLATFLAEKSGGNPYYLEELVRFLREEKLASGRPVKLDVAPSRLPDGIQGLLVARIDALPETDRGVLKAAGAIGRVFWRHLAGHLAGADAGPSLEAARRRSMVYAQEDSMLPDDSQWIFKHALLRDAAYSLLTRKDRRRLHALAADRLETFASSTGRRIRALAAVHREASGESVAAAQLWLRCSVEALEDVSYTEALAAAHEAVRLGGGAEARLAAGRALARVARFKEALSEVRAAGEAPPAVASALAILESEALSVLGDSPGSLAAAERAASLASTTEAVADSDLARSQALRSLGRVVESREALETCLAREGVSKVVRIRARLDLAHLDGLAGRNADALADATQALAEARAAGNVWLEGTALNAVGSFNQSLGNHAAALEAHQACLEQRKRAGDRAGVASSLNNMANIHLSTGAGRKALEGYREAVALSREIGDKRRLGVYLGNIGNGAFRMGEVQEAHAASIEALALQRETGNLEGLAGTLVNFGILQSTVGDAEAGYASFEESLRIRRSIGDAAGCATCLNNMALARVHQDRIPEAVPMYEEALGIRRKTGHRSGVASTLANLGSAYRSLGDFPRALACLEEALSIQKEIGERSGLANSLNYLGATLLAAGRLLESLAAHREAQDLYEHASEPQGIIVSLHGLSATLLRLERFAEAHATARRAVALARESTDRSALSGCLTALALSHHGLAQYGEALSVWREAEDLARKSPSIREVSSCLDGKGSTLAGLGLLTEALEAHAEALSLATRAGDAGLIRLAAGNGLDVALRLNAADRIASFREALAAVPPVASSS